MKRGKVACGTRDVCNDCQVGLCRYELAMIVDITGCRIERQTLMNKGWRLHVIRI